MTLVSLGAIDNTTYLALGSIGLVVIGVTLLRRARVRGVARVRVKRNQPAEVPKSMAHLTATAGIAMESAASDGRPATPPAWRRRIFELADAGSTPISIASTVQAPLGEVELLLSLRRFEQNTARHIKSETNL